MLLSKHSVGNTGIVLPMQPTEREIFAAAELKRYLKLIFDLDLPIQKDGDVSYEQEIVIGGPDRNSRAKKVVGLHEFYEKVPGPEGIFIKSHDNTLVLAGSVKHKNELERGTIYAVYEFLERFLGCSLAAYSKKGVKAGEHLEKAEEVNFSDISYIKPKADVPYRCAVVQYSSHGTDSSHELNFEFLDWLCKNRYNHIYTWNSVYENFKSNGMLDECVKRGIVLKVGHHDAIDTLLPQRGNKYFKEHYYITHPEYYKLTETGERFDMKDHWGQMVLCSRSPGAIEQISKNLIEWFRQNPHVKTYALLNKDGTAPQCCCELCRPYSKVENYVYMVNEIAKRVGEVLDDVTIDMLAYTDLWEAPQISLAENVTVTESTWHSSGLRSIGKPDGSTLEGTFFEENLLGWQKIGAKVAYYDYFMGVYPGRQRYIPMADEMQAMCRRFVEKGIYGTETQIEVFNLWNNIFNFYTFGRTAYDISLSMEDNLKLFCKIFGKGAPYIAENIRHAEDVLDGQSEIMRAGVYLMEHIDKQRMYDGFNKALRAADTPLHRNNIRLMRMAFRYSDLETREGHKKDEAGYKTLKRYEFEGCEELRYMRDNFDSFVSKAGYGIAIPVDCEDTGFVPDEWYQFEE